MIASKEAIAVLFVIAAAGTWGLTGVLSKYLLGSTAPMIVVLIQLSSSMLVSWIIITIKFEEVEIWPAAGSVDTELRCFDGTGGFKWKERSSAASSSLRR